ncbi:UNVERIFIED_CONTAM: hypothetical protein K2H54_057218 [Gekko kuhli]
MCKTEKLKAKQEVQQKRLQYLMTELDRVLRQKSQMEQNKRRVGCKDVLLNLVNRACVNIVKEITQLQKCLRKNPFYEERSNLDQQAGLTPIQETEAKDEGSTKVERKEESKITKELGEEGDENEISKESKEKEGFLGQKLMIKLVLKKDNIQVENKEGEIEESQKESSQSSSETCSLRKTKTDNQSQDQDLAAPEAESTKEGKRRESKPQSGNTDSKQKVTVTKTQNLGMRTKEQKTARVAKLKKESGCGRPANKEDGSRRPSLELCAAARPTSKEDGSHRPLPELCATNKEDLAGALRSQEGGRVSQALTRALRRRAPTNEENRLLRPSPELRVAIRPAKKEDELRRPLPEVCNTAQPAN